MICSLYWCFFVFNVVSTLCWLKLLTRNANNMLHSHLICCWISSSAFLIVGSYTVWCQYHSTCANTSLCSYIINIIIWQIVIMGGKLWWYIMVKWWHSATIHPVSAACLGLVWFDLLKKQEITLLIVTIKILNVSLRMLHKLYQPGALCKFSLLTTHSVLEQFNHPIKHSRMFPVLFHLYLLLKRNKANLFLCRHTARAFFVHECLYILAFTNISHRE